MNHFGDLSHEEFKRGYCGTKVDMTRPRHYAEVDINADVPESIDWTTKGAVNAV
jgi:hypothetical protein